MSKNKTTTPQKIGRFFAYVQDGVDMLATYGFQKMKQVGNTRSTKKSQNTYLENAKNIGKKTLSFFGEIGDAYYKKYEELKHEEADNRKKN